MRLELTSFALILFAVAACGDDGEAREPGTELGACVEGEYCESPFLCTEHNICVHPDSINATDSASASASGASMTSPELDDDDEDDEDPSGDAGTSDGDTAPTEGDSEGPDDDDGNPTTGSGDWPTVYCTSTDTEERLCLCGHSPDFGPDGNECSENSIGDPAICCASQGWPSNGACDCATTQCRDGGKGDCSCGLGASGDPVGGCSAPEGGTCCLRAGSCRCSDIPGCLDSESEVDGCSSSDLFCDGEVRVDFCAL